MIQAMVTAAVMECSATGDIGRTSEHPVHTVEPWLASAPPVSREGRELSQQVGRMARTIERRDRELAPASTGGIVRLGSSMPESFIDFAQALFPNSHAMTPAERRALDARIWSDLEPIEFIDD